MGILNRDYANNVTEVTGELTGKSFSGNKTLIGGKEEEIQK